MKPINTGNYFGGVTAQIDEDDPFRADRLPSSALGSLPAEELGQGDGEMSRPAIDKAKLREGEIVANDFDGPAEASFEVRLSEDEEPLHVHALKVVERLFGFSKFNDGQEEAVRRILKKESTLVVLPTGSGKSLCYQLPAYILSKLARGISIVVTPLLSLMKDQLANLPPGLVGACLNSYQAVSHAFWTKKTKQTR